MPYTGHPEGYTPVMKEVIEGPTKVLLVEDEIVTEDVIENIGTEWELSTDHALPIGVDIRTGLSYSEEEIAKMINGKNTPQARPVNLHGKTYRKKTPVGTAYITINVSEDRTPFEVFINVGKAGSDVAADAEGLGRLISLILRLPGPTRFDEKVKDIVSQLRGIGSGRPQGFGPHRVASLADAVAQALAEHMGIDVDDQLPGLPDVGKDYSLPAVPRTGDLCPECGQATFVLEEGCKKCHGCGYSEC